MELIDITLTPLQRRTGAVWVPWRDLAEQQRRRGEPIKVLAPGDDVLLRTAEGEARRGWVLRNAFAGRQGAYVIMFSDGLARRVPVQRDRRPEPQPAPPAQDVIRVVPARRAPMVSLYL